MQFVSTSLEQSLKINENLTLSEANLREELLNSINDNTEEMNTLMHTHDETIKTFDEKLRLLAKENKELRDRIYQKSALLKKQQRGTNNSLRVISDDEESELEDEDTIDVNKSQYAFTKSVMSRRAENTDNMVSFFILLPIIFLLLFNYVVFFIYSNHPSSTLLLIFSSVSIF